MADGRRSQLWIKAAARCARGNFRGELEDATDYSNFSVARGNRDVLSGVAKGVEGVTVDLVKPQIPDVRMQLPERRRLSGTSDSEVTARMVSRPNRARPGARSRRAHARAPRDDGAYHLRDQLGWSGVADGL
jgi:hypothetical protein